MRDVAATIDALERKAHDGAVNDHEREALLAKAAELRVTHGANPPGGLPPRRPPVSGASNFPAGGWFFMTTSANATTSTNTTFVRMTVT